MLLWETLSEKSNQQEDPLKQELMNSQTSEDGSG